MLQGLGLELSDRCGKTYIAHFCIIRVLTLSYPAAALMALQYTVLLLEKQYLEHILGRLLQGCGDVQRQLTSTVSQCT